MTTKTTKTRPKAIPTNQTITRSQRYSETGALAGRHDQNAFVDVVDSAGGTRIGIGTGVGVVLLFKTHTTVRTVPQTSDYPSAPS